MEALKLAARAAQVKEKERVKEVEADKAQHERQRCRDAWNNRMKHGRVLGDMGAALELPEGRERDGVDVGGVMLRPSIRASGGLCWVHGIVPCKKCPGALVREVESLKDLGDLYDAAESPDAPAWQEHRCEQPEGEEGNRELVNQADQEAVQRTPAERLVEALRDYIVEEVVATLQGGE